MKEGNDNERREEERTPSEAKARQGLIANEANS